MSDPSKNNRLFLVHDAIYGKHNSYVERNNFNSN